MELTLFILMAIISLGLLAIGVYRKSMIVTVASTVMLHSTAVQSFAIDLYTSAGDKVTIQEPALSYLFHGASVIAVMWLFICAYYVITDNINKNVKSKG